MIEKCYKCGKEPTHYNEIRVKSDGIHREIVNTCEKHYHTLIQENVRNRK